MSIASCEGCGTFIDTDENVECYREDFGNKLLCDKCHESRVDEQQEDPHLPAFHEALRAGYKGSFYEWHKENFGSFWCPEVAA